MFNLKISAIAAGTAFVLSLLIGIISGTSFPALLARPLVLGVCFFLFSGFISILIGRFLPELLEEGSRGEGETVLPGSTINITEDTPAVPGMIYAYPDESDTEVGDISQVLDENGKAPASTPESREKPGMDQTGETGYTEERVTASPPDSGASFDTLPDLESLVGSFLPSSGTQEEEIQDYSSSEPAKRPSGNRAKKMEADFNPKDLAAGIRTILKKEEG